MRATQSTRPLVGTCSVPGDKSISHRAALLAALAPGTSRLRGFSPSGDCASTVAVLPALGARTGREGDDLVVTGPPDGPPTGDLGTLDCGRSGTTMRLLAGILAGLPVSATLTGDPQLLRRPMSRVTQPLRSMGAAVEPSPGGGAPITVHGGPLRGITYELPVASAQVKSAILLAGLRATGITTVIEATPTRDHTERLLAAMGARVSSAPGRVTLEASALEPFDATVPGDPSSAAFLLVAAALVPGSDITIQDVGLNPTRTGLLDALARMGAALEVEPVDRTAGGEPFGRIKVRHAALRATSVTPGEVPRLIDELPLVALAATQAEGTTEVRGAVELRVKESDRIGGLAAGLRALGGAVDELPDGLVVHGPTPLHGGTCDARGDHRLAMTFAVAGLIADGPVRVLGGDLVGDSFPGFERALAALRDGPS